MGTLGCVWRSQQHDDPGALNWATGETVAVKEIQLSNIPKSELGEIMVRHSAPCVGTTDAPSRQSEIDLLKNLNVCAVTFFEPFCSTVSAASQHRQVQGLCQDARIPVHHPRVRHDQFHHPHRV